MKHLAILAAAGSLAVFAAPAQAADLPAAPAASVTFAGFSEASFPVSSVAEYDRKRKYDRRSSRGHDRHYDSGRNYRNDRGYNNGRRLGHRDRVWRGNDGRYRCKRDDGTVGLVIGAGVGALLGRQVDQRGDRALGTIIGAVGGGLLGREVDRGGVRCR